MAKKNYNRMYEEKPEATPAEELVVEEAVADIPDEPVALPKKVENGPLTKPFMGIVTGGFSLNVRKSPNGEIITTIPEGAQVRVLEVIDSDWYKIESPKGCVMKKFIKKGK